MNYRLLLPLILICTVFSINAEEHSKERWFEIELLLFQRNIAIKDIEEDLATENIIIDTSKSTRLLKSPVNTLCIDASPCLHKKLPVLINNAQFDSQASGFQRLDNQQLQLAPQRKKLKRHAAFTPLLHLGWRMPVKSRNSAKAIHLFAGENFALNLFNKTATQTITTEPLVANSEGEIEKGNNLYLAESIVNPKNAAGLLTDKWAIDGNFKIYLDHYLFIDSQLFIRQKSTQDITSSTTSIPEQEFEVLNSENDVQVIKQKESVEPSAVMQKTVISEVLFDQNRRLRSAEIHYFDHPLMGVIVQIRKIPEQESAE